jgi:ankyrin repeat protein
MHIEAMVSIVVGTLGPDLMITILQNSHGNGNDPEAHLDYENQEWRVAALMTAAYLGRIKDIKKILALGVAVNPDPGDGWLHPPVMAAALAGRVDVLEFLVAQGADLHNLTVANGDNVVHFAALGGHAGVVGWLLEKGVDGDVVNNNGDTPLLRAAGAGCADVVRVLLAEEGLRANIQDRLGRAPLIWAVERGYEDVVEELLSCERVDVNIADGDGDADPIIPLVVAAATGHENIFRSLLAHPRVHIWVPTLFRRVITGGNVNILKAMIALTMGTDLQKYLLDGNALLLAAELGTEEVLRYLLSFDEANVNYRDDAGATSGMTLLNAAILSNSVGHVNAILEHPNLNMSLITAPDRARLSPLHVAAQQDPLDAGIVAALLVHPDIDVNARDLYQRTPLAYAAVAGQTQMVNILVAQQGVDVSPIDRWGMTPLHYAAENGHLNVVRILLDAPGTNVWHTSIYDKTPLALAAGRAYLDIVKLLLDSRQEAPGDAVWKAMSSASSAKAKFQHGLETLRSRGEGISVKDRLLRDAYGRRLKEACAILELFCAHLERGN